MCVRARTTNGKEEERVEKREREGGGELRGEKKEGFSRSITETGKYKFCSSQLSLIM